MTQSPLYDIWESAGGFKEVIDLVEDGRLDSTTPLPGKVAKVYKILWEQLSQEYSEMRAMLRRRERDIQEQTGFTVCTQLQDVVRVAMLGLRAKSSTQTSLGDPASGVYMCRYSDVAYSQAIREHEDCDAFWMIAYKYMPGKEHAADDDQDGDSEECDSYRHAKLCSVDDEKCFERSQVFLREHNALGQPVSRPRHCLPYAAVLFASSVPIEHDYKPLILTCVDRVHQEKERDLLISELRSDRSGRGLLGPPPEPRMGPPSLADGLLGAPPGGGLGLGAAPVGGLGLGAPLSSNIGLGPPKKRGEVSLQQGAGLLGAPPSLMDLPVPPLSPRARHSRWDSEAVPRSWERAPPSLELKGGAGLLGAPPGRTPDVCPKDLRPGAGILGAPPGSDSRELNALDASFAPRPLMDIPAGDLSGGAGLLGPPPGNKRGPVPLMGAEGPGLLGAPPGLQNSGPGLLGSPTANDTSLLELLPLVQKQKDLLRQQERGKQRSDVSARAHEQHPQRSGASGGVPSQLHNVKDQVSELVASGNITDAISVLQRMETDMKGPSRRAHSPSPLPDPSALRAGYGLLGAPQRSSDGSNSTKYAASNSKSTPGLVHSAPAITYDRAGSNSSREQQSTHDKDWGRWEQDSNSYKTGSEYKHMSQYKQERNEASNQDPRTYSRGVAYDASKSGSLYNYAGDDKAALSSTQGSHTSGVGSSDPYKSYQASADSDHHSRWSDYSRKSEGYAEAAPPTPSTQGGSHSATYSTYGYSQSTGYGYDSGAQSYSQATTHNYSNNSSQSAYAASEPNKSTTTYNDKYTYGSQSANITRDSQSTYGSSGNYSSYGTSAQSSYGSSGLQSGYTSSGSQPAYGSSSTRSAYGSNGSQSGYDSMAASVHESSKRSADSQWDAVRYPSDQLKRAKLQSM